MRITLNFCFPGLQLLSSGHKNARLSARYNQVTSQAPLYFFKNCVCKCLWYSVAPHHLHLEFLGGCELPDMGDGTQTLVLCKSNSSSNCWAICTVLYISISRFYFFWDRHLLYSPRQASNSQWSSCLSLSSTGLAVIRCVLLSSASNDTLGIISETWGRCVEHGAGLLTIDFLNMTKHRKLIKMSPWILTHLTLSKSPI